MEWVPSGVSCFAFHPELPLLAVGRESGNVELWNTEEKFFVEYVISGNDHLSIRSLIWSNAVSGVSDPLHRYRLFGGGLQGSVFEIDLEKMSFSNYCDSFGGPIWSISKQPGSNVMACACEDGSIRLFEMSSERLTYLRSIQLFKKRVVSVSWSPDGSTLAAGASGSRLFIYSMNSAKMDALFVGTTKRKSTIVWDVKFITNSEVVVGDSIGNVQVWDIVSRVMLQQFKSHEGDVLCIGVYSFVDLSKLIQRDIQSMIHGEPVESGVKSRDGSEEVFPITSVVVSAGVDNKLCIYNRSDESDQLSHISSYRVHTHDILCCTIQCMKNNASVFYNSNVPKQLKKDAKEFSSYIQSLKNQIQKRPASDVDRDEEKLAQQVINDNNNSNNQQSNSDKKSKRKKKKEEEKPKELVDSKEVVDNRLSSSSSSSSTSPMTTSSHISTIHSTSQWQAALQFARSKNLPVYGSLFDSFECMVVLSGSVDSTMVVYNIHSPQENNTMRVNAYPGFYNPIASNSRDFVLLQYSKFVELYRLGKQSNVVEGEIVQGPMNEEQVKEQQEKVKDKSLREQKRVKSIIGLDKQRVGSARMRLRSGHQMLLRLNMEGTNNIGGSKVFVSGGNAFIAIWDLVQLKLFKYSVNLNKCTLVQLSSSVRNLHYTHVSFFSLSSGPHLIASTDTNSIVLLNMEGEELFHQSLPCDTLSDNPLVLTHIEVDHYSVTENSLRLICCALSKLVFIAHINLDSEVITLTRLPAPPHPISALAIWKPRTIEKFDGVHVSSVFGHLPSKVRVDHISLLTCLSDNSLFVYDLEELCINNEYNLFNFILPHPLLRQSKPINNIVPVTHTLLDEMEGDDLDSDAESNEEEERSSVQSPAFMLSSNDMLVHVRLMDSTCLSTADECVDGSGGDGDDDDGDGESDSDSESASKKRASKKKSKISKNASEKVKDHQPPHPHPSPLAPKAYLDTVLDSNGSSHHMFKINRLLQKGDTNSARNQLKKVKDCRMKDLGNYVNMVYCSHIMGNKLVIIERPLIDVIAQLPQVVYRHKFGS